tara:strand:- start:150 stop:1142 length:993 start_codon:yes stop_codon:yes gene_type:complete
MDEKRIERDLIKLEISIKWFKRSAFLLIIVGFACIYVVHWQNENVHPMQWNEVGDFLGGTMVGIWSLAGLILIYVAFLGQKQQMIYQQQELQLNRDDLELNRKEIEQTNATLKLQRKEMANQNETAKRQQFENLFFNMIDTHLKIVDDLDTTFEFFEVYKHLDKVYNSRGRDVFMNAFNLFIRPEENGVDRIHAYQKIYEEKSAEFGHYYRFLYRIISRIDEQVFIPMSSIDPTGDSNREYYLYNYEIRYEYTSIVRSLLSDEELEMLFFNMLLYRDLKFKKLIERYCLLKNIPNSQVKINHPEYDFDAGAIRKSRNLDLIELDRLKEAN